jgi:hypothetical protein
MADDRYNPWKLTAIGMGLVVVVAVITGVVVANWSGREVERKAQAPDAATLPAATHQASPGARVASAPVTPRPIAAASAQPQPTAVPSQVTIDACNQQAAQAAPRNKTTELVKDGAIGALVGAAVGAAGGAIAGGGSGAGKGAMIGGVLGAGGGALYGVNENGKHDARYREAYASCMRARGYAS